MGTCGLIADSSGGWRHGSVPRSGVTSRETVSPGGTCNPSQSPCRWKRATTAPSARRSTSRRPVPPARRIQQSVHGRLDTSATTPMGSPPRRGGLQPVALGDRRRDGAVRICASIVMVVPFGKPASLGTASRDPGRSPQAQPRGGRAQHALLVGGPSWRHWLDRLRRERQSLLAISGVAGAMPSGKSSRNASFTNSGAPRM